MATAEQILALYKQHEDYWATQRPDLRAYSEAYKGNFWRSKGTGTTIAIQTGDAYEHIESYLGSLFTRAPSAVVQQGPLGGDPAANAEKTEVILNAFLLQQRGTIESTSRLALLYPNAAVKLTVCGDEPLGKAIEATAIPPWEIMVDASAPSWETQRFIGHVYLLPLEEAQTRYGRKSFIPGTYSAFLDDADIPELGQFVRIIEYYDLVADKLIIVSPDHQAKHRVLASKKIPYRTYAGKPLVSIVPLYYASDPDVPLRGYSAMARVYDQIKEINLIRSYQASAVRKAARLYAARKDAVSEEDLARIAAGEDGAIIMVDGDPTQTIWPIPSIPTPPELQTYYNQVKADKDKGSLLAPFTRGEPVKVTATEIRALAAYSSSEIGRMAVVRDTFIAALGKTYLAMLGYYLETSSKDGTGMIVVQGKRSSLTLPDITSDWEVWAEDQGSTPSSLTAKKQEFLQLVPILAELGVPPDAILKELAKTYGLPDALVKEAVRALEIKTQQAQQAQQAQQPQQAGGILGNAAV